HLYFNVFASGAYTGWYVTLDEGNYTGTTLAAEVQLKLNLMASGTFASFAVSYKHIQNQISISFFR
ncbi:MAG: hypothetical protein ACKPKO_43475, partial [Candidatus Fonsibacter sp.]